jgi:hypothetical protein
MSQVAKGIVVGSQIDPIGEYLRFRERQTNPLHVPPSNSWREVATRSLLFIKRFPQPGSPTRDDRRGEWSVGSQFVNFLSNEADRAERRVLGQVGLLAQVRTDEVPTGLSETEMVNALIEIGLQNLDQTRTSLLATPSGVGGQKIMILSAEGIAEAGLVGFAPGGSSHMNYFRAIVGRMHEAGPATPAVLAQG